ncbi:MAG: rRNA pseudouridine synthase [Anaerolineae bacterium]|nr:rRNA pseudouridine synthase [Anaerolineae bacterium]
MEERLQKLIAQAGLASRREAEELIRQMQVTVNGKIAALGDKADPSKDDVRVAGQRLRFEATRYVILFKKRGVVSSTEAQGERPTVVDIVKAKERLYPVGRLDIDSDGLILLTNDGELTNKLTHPRYGLEKTYKVMVTGKPPRETLEKWQNGIFLDGERTLPCTIRVISGEGDGPNAVLRIVMKEGRKRQIRRMAELLGHPVLHLTRTHIGPLGLGTLKPGQWRELTPGEVRMLKEAVEPHPRKKPTRPRKPPQPKP